MIPAAVLSAYGLGEASFEPIHIGLINRTFRVDRGGVPWLALQELHPVFAGEVNLDLEAITTHIAKKGLLTPRLHRALDGSLWVTADGRPWRALTWLEGRVHRTLGSEAAARTAGRVVGRFHAAVADLDHRFAFVREGAHDTERHLGRLSAALVHAPAEVRALGDAILAHTLPALPKLPTRIIHGDLKVTNLLFDEAGLDAIALLDLDTLAHGTLAVELGDALRSWCNPAGESAERVAVDERLFGAAVAGYADSGVTLTREEIAGIVPGLETIALELASRFCLDAIEDRYFGWDPTRFPSRVAHNTRRAEAQLALAASVRAHRGSLEATASAALLRKENAPQRPGGGDQASLRRDEG